jgi:hypothetical protein
VRGINRVVYDITSKPPGTTHFGIVKRDAWIEPMMDALTRPSL